VIDELEQGRMPWVQPWDGSACGCAMPHNAGSGRLYSGISVLILWSAVIKGGYSSQRWLAYRQAQALGSHVRRGEAGVTICYADRFTPKSEEEVAETGGRDARQRAFLKRFTVFNIDQCEGLPEALRQAPALSMARETIPRAEALIEATASDFRIGGPMAFYSVRGRLCRSAAATDLSRPDRFLPQA
jgi:antirestriction protein ArdC